MTCSSAFHTARRAFTKPVRWHKTAAVHSQKSIVGSRVELKNRRSRIRARSGREKALRPRRCKDMPARAPASALLPGPELRPGSLQPAKHTPDTAPRSYSRSYNPGKDRRKSGGNVPSSGKSSSSAHLIAAMRIATQHGIQGKSHSTDAGTLHRVASRMPIPHLFW